jgi:hypothetical protein
MIVLRSLNAREKLKIAKTAQEQDFEQPILDGQIDFDEIYLNINKNQVFIYSIYFNLIYFEILVFRFTSFT